jgi:hydroxyacylglutathione hydrolase
METEALKLEDFKKLMKEDYQVIDLRENDSFCEAYIPGSINIPLDDDFTEIARYFIFKSEKLLLVTEPGWEDYSFRKLKTMNYKALAGYLYGGFPTWNDNNQPIDVVVSIDAEEMELDLKYGNQVYYDIRSENEFDASHIENSENVEPIVLIEDPSLIGDKINICMYCSNGKLSMSLISYLKTRRKHNIHHIRGGFIAISGQSGIPLVLKKRH